MVPTECGRAERRDRTEKRPSWCPTEMSRQIALSLTADTTREANRAAAGPLYSSRCARRVRERSCRRGDAAGVEDGRRSAVSEFTRRSEKVWRAGGAGLGIGGGLRDEGFGLDCSGCGRSQHDITFCTGGKGMASTGVVAPGWMSMSREEWSGMTPGGSDNSGVATEEKDLEWDGAMEQEDEAWRVEWEVRRKRLG